MVVNGIIHNFKELMDEFFYDWKMTPNPQINICPDGFWVNKTSLFKENNQYYLTYKTSSYRVLPKAFINFEHFYKNLYQNDDEFASVLDSFNWEWLCFSNSLVKTSNGFYLGNISIISKDLKYYLIEKDRSIELTENCFKKISKFYELLTT